MEKQTILTRVGLAVVVFVTIVVILYFYLCYMQVPNGYHRQRVICGTNLKGIGTALTVYSMDYDDKYPVFPGSGPWSKRLGFDYDNPAPDFSENGAEGNVSRTITANWYFLVRECDVSPKSFVCPESKLTEFDGSNSRDAYLVELWDFGSNPHEHVSYAYHNPYGKYPANGTLSAAFAVAADMNPWFVNGEIIETGTNNQPPQILTIFDDSSKEIAQKSNASHHDYESQNVLFADGHTANEKTSNIGVNNDNIYTFWSTEGNPTVQDIQGGTAPTSRRAENDAKSETDSFLAI